MVELVVVLSIVSVLSAIAVPGLRTMIGSYELQAAGFDAAARLSDARTNALKRNRQTWLLVSADAGTMQLQTLDPTTGNAINVGAPHILPDDVEVVTPNGEATLTIRFDPMGRPVDNAGAAMQQALQIRHEWSAVTRTITAGTTGRIRVN